jgi:hypothetical protein
VNIRQDDNSTTRFWVSSESEHEAEYLVELAENPIGRNPMGALIFNGACISTKKPESVTEWGCAHFRYKCESELKRPSNMGKSFRCKHIIFARNWMSSLATDTLIAKLAEQNPNLPDHHLP